jgi:hypothetical protein
MAVVLVSNFCGCAGPSRYGESSGGGGYRLEGAENGQSPRENILLYPPDWPEISARRERRD